MEIYAVTALERFVKIRFWSEFFSIFLETGLKIISSVIFLSSDIS